MDLFDLHRMLTSAWVFPPRDVSACVFVTDTVADTWSCAIITKVAAAVTEKWDQLGLVNKSSETVKHEFPLLNVARSDGS